MTQLLLSCYVLLRLYWKDLEQKILPTILGRIEFLWSEIIYQTVSTFFTSWSEYHIGAFTSKGTAIWDTFAVGFAWCGLRTGIIWYEKNTVKNKITDYSSTFYSQLPFGLSHTNRADDWHLAEDSFPFPPITTQYSPFFNVTPDQYGHEFIHTLLL